MAEEIKIKILVIDDEEILRERLKRLLELDDYEVTTAENGFRGLEEFTRVAPDIVFLDIKMPGMDGIEVLDRLKQLPHSAEVFIMTGHGGLETAIAALRKGAFDYMTKPVDFDELEINLKRAQEKRLMKRQLDVYVRDLEAAKQRMLAIRTLLDNLLANPAITADPKLVEVLLKMRD